MQKHMHRDRDVADDEWAMSYDVVRDVADDEWAMPYDVVRDDVDDVVHDAI